MKFKKLSGVLLLSALSLMTGFAPISAADAVDNTISYTEDPMVSEAKDSLDCSLGESKVVLDSLGEKHAIKCQTLEENESSNEGIVSFANHWSPYENAYFRCGSSYVRNQQIAWYRYRGTVYASGEYGSGESCGGAGRVTAASITYKRDGKVLGYARAGIGETKTTGAWDHPGLNHSPTQLFYDFTLS